MRDRCYQRRQGQAITTCEVVEGDTVCYREHHPMLHLSKRNYCLATTLLTTVTSSPHKAGDEGKRNRTSNKPPMDESAHTRKANNLGGPPTKRRGKRAAPQEDITRERTRGHRQQGHKHLQNK